MSTNTEGVRIEIRLVSLFRDVAMTQERCGGKKAKVASRHRKNFERKIQALEKEIKNNSQNICSIS
jgi:hypothetical protein